MRADASLAYHNVAAGAAAVLAYESHLREHLPRVSLAEIRSLRHRDGHVFRELHERRGFARCPSLQNPAIGIVERRRNGMLAPQSRTVRRTMTLVGFLAPGHAERLSFVAAAVQPARRIRAAIAGATAKCRSQG